MSATAKGYFDALVALSGDPTLSDARHDLITKITDDQLKGVILHGLSRENPRQRLEAIIMKLLDATTEIPIAGAILEEQVVKTEKDTVILPSPQLGGATGAQIEGNCNIEDPDERSLTNNKLRSRR